jgi:hypothetical protein
MSSASREAWEKLWVEKNDRHPGVAADLPKDGFHAQAEAGVDVGRRLVEQKDRRPQGQGPGQGHALGLSRAQAGHGPLLPARELDEVQGFGDARGPFVFGNARTSSPKARLSEIVPLKR